MARPTEWDFYPYLPDPHTEKFADVYEASIRTNVQYSLPDVLMTLNGMQEAQR